MLCKAAYAKHEQKCIRCATQHTWSMSGSAYVVQNRICKHECNSIRCPHYVMWTQIMHATNLLHSPHQVHMDELYSNSNSICSWRCVTQVCDYPSFQNRTSLAGHMERVLSCKFDPSGRHDQALHSPFVSCMYSAWEYARTACHAHFCSHVVGWNMEEHCITWLYLYSHHASSHVALLDNFVQGGMTSFCLSRYTSLIIQRDSVTVDCAWRMLCMLTHRALSCFRADSNQTSCYMVSEHFDGRIYPVLKTVPGHCTCCKTVDVMPFMVWR